ncbi:MAG: DUF885 domain-containing protein [Pseudomonadales bacterium]
MNKLLPGLIIVLLAASCSDGGGSDGNTPLPAADPVVTGPSAAEQLITDLEGLALTDFYNTSYQALISRTPETIVWQALTDTFPLEEVDLDDLSDAYQRETFAMYQVVLERLLTYDRATLDADEQLTYDVYQWHLQDTVDQLEFIYYDFAATYISFSVQRNTQRFFTDIHPLATQQDAEDYVTRLKAVERKFRQLADHLNLQRDAGITEPALTLEIAVAGVTSLAEGGAEMHPYFTSFRDKINNIAELGSTDRENLLDAARTATEISVIPGYQRLRQTMQGLRTSAPPSIGVGQFPRGNDYYVYMLRHHTTTDLTAVEIHQLGLAELQRIHDEMRLIFNQLGYPLNETLQQLFARVAADGGVIPAADVLTTYESIIDIAQQDLVQAFDIFPTADVAVIADDFGGFYIGPSFDGTRPGAFYAGTTIAQPSFQMPSLAYHESIPGHHLQISLAMEQDVPAFRKLVRFTGFVEGWALYAERLAYELGWYDSDPYGNLGRLQYEALRAARLVMDTGIHSLSWSFDEAVRFNEDNVGLSTGASQGAAGRYSVLPGQATAYMVGMLQILQSRQRAMDELGSRFDLKEFHRVLLSSGAIPLALLDSVVDRYIAAKLAVTD